MEKLLNYINLRFADDPNYTVTIDSRTVSTLKGETFTDVEYHTVRFVDAATGESCSFTEIG